MGKENNKSKESHLENAIAQMFKKLEAAASAARQREESDLKALENLQFRLSKYVKTIPEVVEQEVRERTRSLKEENRELKQQLKERPLVATQEAIDYSEISKASTICIFDTLLFAIENWSTDGLTAPDVSLCSQSVLFPLVYEQVMKGNEDYYIDKFPSISMEVVRRGRSFVQWLRDELPTALNSQEVWDSHAEEVQSWWVNDGLPLLYGARDPNWGIGKAYSFEDMVKWRDLPASRVLEFPLISDGMDLVTKHMDSVRDSIGLKNFNQQQIQTRFTHE